MARFLSFIFLLSYSAVSFAETVVVGDSSWSQAYGSKEKSSRIIVSEESSQVSDTAPSLLRRSLAAVPLTWDTYEKRLFRFFWDNGDAGHNFLVPQRINLQNNYHDPWVSCAGSGFALVAYAVGANRGWVSWDAALERIEQTLSFYQNAEHRLGMLAHFYDIATGSKGANDVEYSTLDTAWFLMGALWVKSCLISKQEQGVVADSGRVAAIVRMVDVLYERVNWHAALSADGQFLSHGWLGHGQDRSPYAYENYDESWPMYLLAIGSPRQDYRISASLWSNIRRTAHIVPIGNSQTVAVLGYDLGLFAHIFPLMWMDMRPYQVPVSSVDQELMPLLNNGLLEAKDSLGYNYYQNTIHMVNAQQEYARELWQQDPEFFSAYGDYWGLSATWLGGPLQEYEALGAFRYRGLVTEDVFKPILGSQTAVVLERLQSLGLLSSMTRSDGVKNYYIERSWQDLSIAMFPDLSFAQLQSLQEIGRRYWPDTASARVVPSVVLASRAFAPEDVDAYFTNLTSMYHFPTDMVVSPLDVYGFTSSFSFNRPMRDRDRVNSEYVDIDVGMQLLMIENDRTGWVWQVSSGVKSLQNALKSVGFPVLLGAYSSAANAASVRTLVQPLFQFISYEGVIERRVSILDDVWFRLSGKILADQKVIQVSGDPGFKSDVTTHVFAKDEPQMGMRDMVSLAAARKEDKTYYVRGRYVLKNEHDAQKPYVSLWSGVLRVVVAKTPEPAPVVQPPVDDEKNPPVDFQKPKKNSMWYSIWRRLRQWLFW